MDFGKLEDISQVDFSFPQKTNQKKVGNASRPQIWVGCPIWANPLWKGEIYPPNAKNQEFLYYYAQQFNCIELNSTHYQIPDKISIEKWKNHTPPNFLFCPKLPQSISHEHQLQNCEHLLDQFCENISHLGSRLGLCFLQMSPYFSPLQRDILLDFLQKFPKNIPLALELRHQDWFRDEDIFEQLSQISVPSVITDVAGRRDVLHLNLTSAISAVRFVGNALHATDYQRLDRWVEQILEWSEQGLEKLYFWIHQPDNILAPQTVKYFVEKLNQNGFSLSAPQFYKKKQTNLF